MPIFKILLGVALLVVAVLLCNSVLTAVTNRKVLNGIPFSRSDRLEPREQAAVDAIKAAGGKRSHFMMMVVAAVLALIFAAGGVLCLVL